MICQLGLFCAISKMLNQKFFFSESCVKCKPFSAAQHRPPLPFTSAPRRQIVPPSPAFPGTWSIRFSPHSLFVPCSLQLSNARRSTRAATLPTAGLCSVVPQGFLSATGRGHLKWGEPTFYVRLFCMPIPTSVQRIDFGKADNLFSDIHMKDRSQDDCYKWDMDIISQYLANLCPGIAYIVSTC